MKIKINLSFLSMINKLESDKLRSDRLTAFEWKVLLYGIGKLRNNLYKHIGTEKDKEIINNFLRRKMTSEDREIHIDKKNRKKYFGNIKPNIIFKRIEKLSRSEIVLINTADKAEGANIVTDRGFENSVNYFNFETRFIKEMYLGEGGYSLVTDNVFKLKKPHSIPLAILMSRYHNNFFKTAEQWNEFFSVNLQKRDLTRFIAAAIEDINKNMEFNLRLVKLDHNKKEVTGNQKFTYINIVREDKVIETEEEVTTCFDDIIEGMNLSCDKNKFKKEVLEALEKNIPGDVSLRLEVAERDGFEVSSYEQLCDVFDNQLGEWIPECMYESRVLNASYDDFKEQFDIYRTRMPKVYKKIMECSENQDPVEVFRDKVLDGEIKIEVLF